MTRTRSVLPSSVSRSALAVVLLAAAPASAQEKAAPAPPAPAPAAKGATEPAADAGADDEDRDDPRAKPTPLQVDYAQYGVGFAGEFIFEPGGICPSDSDVPCIIGIGGGPNVRGGYRPSGPWYIGGAYSFAKLDSNNLLRLGILQELRAEMRYYIATGSPFSPYGTWSLGGMIYGNEFGVETGGITTSAGVGCEFELTRFAVVGLNTTYKPMLFVGFTDTAGQERGTGVAHSIHLEAVIELRTELGRE